MTCFSSSPSFCAFSRDWVVGGRSIDKHNVISKNSNARRYLLEPFQSFHFLQPVSSIYGIPVPCWSLRFVGMPPEPVVLVSNIVSLIVRSDSPNASPALRLLWNARQPTSAIDYSRPFGKPGHFQSLVASVRGPSLPV